MADEVMRPRVVHNALNSVGQPLDLTTRSNFESRFGYDFSAVQVHHDPVAQESARRLHAKAYTVGQDIVFSKGRYSPDSDQGRELIAEELAHTIQQSRGGDVPKLDPSAAHEQDAKSVAKAAVNGSGPVTVHSATGVGIARSIDDWLEMSLDISNWSPTRLLDEADEIQQWLNYQIQTTPETIILEKALESIGAEFERDNEVFLQHQKKKTRGRKRNSIQKPRILREGTSVQISDPDEVREEVDLIVSWLHLKDLPSDEREILQIELENLEPSLREARVQKVDERRAIKIEQALTPELSEDALVQMVEAQKLIDNIIPLPNQPGYSYLIYGNEMIVVQNSEVEAKRQSLIKIRDEAEVKHSLLNGPKRETVVPYATADIIGKSFGVGNITPKEMEDFLRGDVKGFVKNASKHVVFVTVQDYPLPLPLYGALGALQYSTGMKQVEALQRMATLFALNNQVAVGARKKEDVSSQDWGYINFMMAEAQLQSAEDRKVREGFQTPQGAYSRKTSKRHKRLLEVFSKYNMSRGDFMDLMAVAKGTDENMYSMREFFEEKAIDAVSGKIIMVTIEIEMLLIGGAAFKGAKGAVRVGLAFSEGAGVIASGNVLPKQIGSIVGNSNEAKTGLEYVGASEEFSRKVTAYAGIASLATGVSTGLLAWRHIRQLDKAGRLVLALEAPSIETAEAFVKGVSRQARVEAGAALEEMVKTSTSGLDINAYRTVDTAVTTQKQLKPALEAETVLPTQPTKLPASQAQGSDKVISITEGRPGPGPSDALKLGVDRPPTPIGRARGTRENYPDPPKQPQTMEEPLAATGTGDIAPAKIVESSGTQPRISDPTVAMAGGKLPNLPKQPPAHVLPRTASAEGAFKGSGKKRSRKKGGADRPAQEPDMGGKGLPKKPVPAQALPEKTASAPKQDPAVSQKPETKKGRAKTVNKELERVNKEIAELEQGEINRLLERDLPPDVKNDLFKTLAQAVRSRDYDPE
ncbi:MAG: DUF4157 domain-containing protein, partial [Deltaproteobacteria bacterium]|nr:DUF4157 domain-containing protein [Deltaproteobacteria bacterium]